MASEVDIANLALAHLGDSATIASLNPPEGSAQAEHCARFYPVARDTLLEMHTWNFAMRRASPAELTNTCVQWDYAYARPADCLRVVAVLPPDADDDYIGGNAGVFNLAAPYGGLEVEQPYVMEINDSLAQVIYTDQQDALIRYIARVTDTTKFSALFTLTLSWHLAAMLAGPVIKGDVGKDEAKRCTQMMGSFLAQAKTADLASRNVKPRHVVPWLSGR